VQGVRRREKRLKKKSKKNLSSMARKTNASPCLRWNLLGGKGGEKMARSANKPSYYGGGGRKGVKEREGCRYPREKGKELGP